MTISKQNLGRKKVNAIVNRLKLTLAVSSLLFAFLVFANGCGIQNKTIDQPLKPVSTVEKQGESIPESIKSKKSNIYESYRTKNIISDPKHISISSKDELKWMEFCRVVRDNFSDFELNRPNEKDLIENIVFYILFEYSDEEQNGIVINDQDGFLGVKKEEVEKVYEKFFGQKITEHRATENIIFKNGYYYPPDCGREGESIVHIIDFMENNDGIITIEYVCYFYGLDEDSIFDNLKTKDFIRKIHEEPDKFPEPDAEGRTKVKKIIQNNEERYIIIENYSESFNYQ